MPATPIHQIRHRERHVQCGNPRSGEAKCGNARAYVLERKGHSPTPGPPSNHLFRHTYNPLISNAFCVCQIDTVLHYSLRAERRTELKWRRSGQICRQPQSTWHKQNRPEPRVARGKPRSDKANREQLALNSGGGVRACSKLTLKTGACSCGTMRMRGTCWTESRQIGLYRGSSPHQEDHQFDSARRNRTTDHAWSGEPGQGQIRS